MTFFQYDKRDESCSYPWLDTSFIKDSYYHTFNILFIDWYITFFQDLIIFIIPLWALKERRYFWWFIPFFCHKPLVYFKNLDLLKSYCLTALHTFSNLIVNSTSRVIAWNEKRIDNEFYSVRAVLSFKKKKNNKIEVLSCWHFNNVHLTLQTELPENQGG